MATALTIIWWLYGYRLWKQSRREGNYTIVGIYLILVGLLGLGVLYQ